MRESDHISAPYTRISCWWVIMSAWTYIAQSPTYHLGGKSHLIQDNSDLVFILAYRLKRIQIVFKGKVFRKYTFFKSSNTYDYRLTISNYLSPELHFWTHQRCRACVRQRARWSWDRRTDNHDISRIFCFFRPSTYLSALSANHRRTPVKS